MTANTLLEVTHLSCMRQGQQIFADLTFNLCAGEILLVTGQNGAGKSSLLRLLAGLATPASGEIVRHHTDLHYLAHTNGIKLDLSVAENLKLTTQLNNATMDNLDPVLGLNAHLTTLAKYLSAGQKRRLALSRLFLMPKRLWILDEPLTALDATMQAYFLAYLKQHIEQGGAVIMSSHQPIVLPNLVVKTLGLTPC